MKVSSGFWLGMIAVALLLLVVIFFKMSSPVGYVIFSVGQDFSVGDDINGIFVFEVNENIDSKDGVLVSLTRGSEEISSELYYSSEIMSCSNAKEGESYPAGEYNIDLACLMDYTFERIGKYDLVFISLSENRRQVRSYLVE